jgi:hypothetical protein
MFLFGPHYPYRLIEGHIGVRHCPPLVALPTIYLEMANENMMGILEDLV